MISFLCAIPRAEERTSVLLRCRDWRMAATPAPAWVLKTRMAHRLDYTRTFTPKTMNELRVGFNYVHIRRGVP